MLTQLSTIKSRLAIPDLDTTYDALLTTAASALSARFDKECNRTFARTEGATFEFDAGDTELTPPCYPIEAVTKWEAKTSELDGWIEKSGADYLIRSGCVISLRWPTLYSPPSSQARITYTGGYVLPGTEPGPGQAPLPADIQQACVEQIAFWFQNRDHLGLKTYWPSGTAYYQFAAFDLLDSVKTTLKKHTRWSI